jgi:hypothetical protein
MPMRSTKSIDGANAMRTMAGRSFLLACLIAMSSAGVAYGKECRDVSFPDQAQVDGNNLTLNGLGVRKATFLKVNVYVAALYVAKKSSDPGVLLGSNAPAELIVHFVRDVGVKDITGAWDEGFANNAKAQLPALKDRIAMLNGLMSDMKTGQRTTFSFQPGVGTKIAVNGMVKGTIKGDDFAKALLSVWLGAEPANPELKAGLLGGACG